MKLRNKNTNTEGEGHIIFTKDGIEISYEVYSDKNGHCGLNCKCHTLKDLADNFEIVEDKPAEPLIKDEKIRKAVRLWAEANELIEVCYDAEWNAFRLDGFTCNFDYDFDRFDGLVDACHYTIAELCGEDEK